YLGFSFGPPPLFAEAPGAINKALRDLLALFTKDAAPQRQRPLKVRLSFVGQTELEVRMANGVAHRGLDFRLPRQLSAQPCGEIVEQLTDRIFRAFKLI